MEITVARHSLQYARFLQFPLHCDHGRDREYVAGSAPQPGRGKRMRGSEASQAASQNAHAAEKNPWPSPLVAVVCAGSTLHPLAARVSQAGRHRRDSQGPSIRPPLGLCPVPAWEAHCLSQQPSPTHPPPPHFVSVPLGFPPSRLLLYLRRPSGNGEHAGAGATSIWSAVATTNMQRWVLNRSGVVGHSARALAAGAFAAGPAGAPGLGGGALGGEGEEGRDCETERQERTKGRWWKGGRVTSGSRVRGRAVLITSAPR